jgi:hypothetical protein
MVNMFKRHALAFKNEAEAEDELEDEGKTIEEAEEEFFED